MRRNILEGLSCFVIELWDVLFHFLLSSMFSGNHGLAKRFLIPLKTGLLSRTLCKQFFFRGSPLTPTDPYYCWQDMTLLTVFSLPLTLITLEAFMVISYKVMLWSFQVFCWTPYQSCNTWQVIFWYPDLFNNLRISRLCESVQTFSFIVPYLKWV